MFVDQKQKNMNVIVNQEQKVINAEHIQINKDVIGITNVCLPRERSCFDDCDNRYPQMCSVQKTQYCTRTLEPICETCTRDVPKVCERDVIEDQVVFNDVAATTLHKTSPQTTTLQNGSISGNINSSGELIGNYIGAEETAPKHTYVRYFIRAIP